MADNTSNAAQLRQMSLPYLLSSYLAPVQENLIKYLEPLDLIALKRTAKTFADVDDTVQSTGYNINKFLKPFFEDPLEFRKLQAKWNALIGGDIARAFFLCNPSEDKSLDLFIHEDDLSELMEYLQEEGYASRGCYPVHTKFLHFTKLNKEDVEMNICVIYDDCPIKRILDGGFTTAHLNLIAWNKT